METVGMGKWEKGQAGAEDSQCRLACRGVYGVACHHGRIYAVVSGTKAKVCMAFSPFCPEMETAYLSEV